MAERKMVSSITDIELSALYQLVEARYPVSETTLVVSFEAPVAQPKERHRKGAGGRMYTPEKTVAAEEAIGWSFKNAARGHRVDEKSRFGLVIAVAGANSAADVDNLAKTVMDGLQGVLYENDKQVDELHVRRLPGRQKRTEVTVYRIEEGSLCRGFASTTGSRRTARSNLSRTGPIGCTRPRFSGVLVNLPTGVYRNVTWFSLHLAP